MRRILALTILLLLITAPAALAEDEFSGRLIYLSDRNGPQHLYMLDLATGEETPLVEGSVDIWDAACSADGTQIAITGGAILGIDILDLTTGEIRAAFRDLVLGRSTLGWSPDGSQFALSQPNELSTGYRLLIADIGTETVTPLDLPDLPYPNQPAWSPDGSLIAVTGYWNFISSVMVVPPDGTEFTRLAEAAIDADNSAWSPDGTRLAYTQHEAARVNIYAVELETGEVTALAEMETEAYYAAHMPAWSPDGRYVAFSSMMESSQDLYVRSLETGEVTRVSDHPGHEWLHCWLP